MRSPSRFLFSSVYGETGTASSAAAAAASSFSSSVDSIESEYESSSSQEDHTSSSSYSQWTPSSSRTSSHASATHTSSASEYGDSGGAASQAGSAWDGATSKIGDAWSSYTSARKQYHTLCTYYRITAQCFSSPLQWTLPTPPSLHLLLHPRAHRLRSSKFMMDCTANESNNLIRRFHRTLSFSITSIAMMAGSACLAYASA